jgi:hypothetical protein
LQVFKGGRNVKEREYQYLDWVCWLAERTPELLMNLKLPLISMEDKLTAIEKFLYGAEQQGVAPIDRAMMIIKDLYGLEVTDKLDDKINGCGATISPAHT